MKVSQVKECDLCTRMSKSPKRFKKNCFLLQKFEYAVGTMTTKELKDLYTYVLEPELKKIKNE